MTPPGAAPDPLPSPSASSAPTPPARRRRRTRRRFWLLLALTLLVSLALYPPPWHAALRTLLTWEASRRGWELEIGGIQGGLFDVTTLYDVHCHRRNATPSSLSPSTADGPPSTSSAFHPPPSTLRLPNGSDVRIARVEAVPAWRWPFFQPPAGSWLRRLTLEGVSGTLDFTPAAAPLGQGTPAARVLGVALPPSLDPLPLLALRCVPESFELLRVDCLLRRGPVTLQTRRARLTAYRNGPGIILARGVTVSGPGFENTLANLHGQTLWQRPSLTFTGLSLGRGVELTRISLDAAQLWSRRQLRWDGDLTALNGDIRSQGTVNLSRERLDLDAAGSFQQVAVRPLARLLGIDGPTDGNVEQGQFSFRGDPVDWASATISLAVSARDFRWRQRRWQNLELAAVVVNRRAQVRKLELRQSRNQLSFNGECALPLPPESAGALAWLQGGGFTGNIDAKLDDLRALAQLLGPGLPEVGGRMSVNGAVAAARGQGKGLDGYLNVEGSELSLAGAPLDYLHSTLILRGEDMQVADLQATRATDYFTGKGTFRIVGAPRYQAELRAAVDDLSAYRAAFAGESGQKPWAGSLWLEWRGEGAPGAHGGTFRGNVRRFSAGSAVGALARPIDAEAEGAYTPDALTLRRLSLQEGEGDKRRDALRLAGELPWKQDASQKQDASRTQDFWPSLAAGRWLDPARPLNLRVEFADAPLDVLFALVTQNWPDAPTAAGRLNGQLEIHGPAQTPLANGALQIRDGALRWPDDSPSSPRSPFSPLPVERFNADLRAEDSAVSIEQGRGTRGGIDWQLGGRVEWQQDPSHPLLALTLRAPRIARALDNDFARADANVSLRVDGPWPGDTVSGEARLLGGEFYRQLTLLPATEALGESEASEAFLPVARWLPRELLDRQIDLRVTADPPLSILTQKRPNGELAPDLRLTGAARAPLVSGRLDFTKTRLTLPGADWFLPRGTLYFNAASPDAPTPMPTLAFSATVPSLVEPTEPGAGQPAEKQIVLYGSADKVQTVQFSTSGAEPPRGEAWAEPPFEEPANDWLSDVWETSAQPPPTTPWADATLWLTAPPLEAAPPDWAVRLR